MTTLPAPELVELRVTHVATTHARYEWDGANGAIRLAGIQTADGSPAAAELVDRAEMGLHDRAIPILLVRRVPTFPDCRVAGRLIGLHRAGESVTLVAVPTADPAFQRVATLSDLPTHLYTALTQCMRTGIWHEADAARTWHREARAEARTARAQSRRLGGRAWQAVTPVAADDVRNKTGRHSIAEYHLRDVPARFQDYMAELLYPSERILALVHRPPPIRRGLFRREPLPEALLLITDRQVLTMADTIPPDSTMARWGFVAESAALTRFATVALEEAHRVPTLTAMVAARYGTSAIRFALPDGGDALAAPAALLRGFLPRHGSRALLWHERLREAPDTWATLEALWRYDPTQWAIFTDLKAAILDHLGPDEFVCAWAGDPAWDARRRSLLLALTPTRLIHAEESKPLEEIPIAEIATALLQHSPIGSWLGVRIPDRSGVHDWRIHCYALSYHLFSALFAVLRRAIATPVAATVCIEEREAADG